MSHESCQHRLCRRAVLADSGLLNAGGYGCFELPEAPMGQSPGMENVLLTRCLETELARTIEARL